MRRTETRFFRLHPVPALLPFGVQITTPSSFRPFLPSQDLRLPPRASLEAEASFLSGTDEQG